MNYYLNLIIYLAIQLLIGFTPYHYSELTASVFSVYCRSFFVGPTKFRDNLRKFIRTRLKRCESKKSLFRSLSDIFLTEEMFFIWEICKHRKDIIRLIKWDNVYFWPLYFYIFGLALEVTYPLVKR